MLEPLHLGMEHPNLLWVGGAALLGFGAGLGIGLQSGRSEPAARTETTGEPENE